AAIGTAEKVDATVVLIVLDALEHDPGFVDARGHAVSIGRVGPPTNRRAACATRSCRRARAPAGGSAARPDRPWGEARGLRPAARHARVPRPSARRPTRRAPLAGSAHRRCP